MTPPLYPLPREGRGYGVSVHSTNTQNIKDKLTNSGELAD